MTVQVLQKFATDGVISAPKERASALSLVGKLDIASVDLDQPIVGLSGGNQQKAVLARSFLYDAKVILIDEPTQGVDAKARFDIYRADPCQSGRGGHLRDQFVGRDGIGWPVRPGAGVLPRTQSSGN